LHERDPECEPLPPSPCGLPPDDYRYYVPGTVEYTRDYPMNADDLAGDAGAIRDSVLYACLDEDIHTFYPGAFKSAHKMPKIISGFAEQGSDVHFHYVAGNSSFNRLMTEYRYVQGLITAMENPDMDFIIRNVEEDHYAVIEEGSSEVVELLEEIGREAKLTSSIAKKYAKGEAGRAKAMDAFIDKAIPLASLVITDRFGDVLYDNKFDGKENRNALDVLANEENRPFNEAEKAIIQEAIDTFCKAAKLGVLKEDDFERISERALDPVMRKIEKDLKLDSTHAKIFNEGKAARDENCQSNVNISPAEKGPGMDLA
jgi:hypothetical protein